MQEVDYLIIGGGISGTTAAETIRRRDPDGRVVIISGEAHRLYARTLLSKPKMYQGEYEAEELFLRSHDWYKEHKIELVLGKFAIQHNPHRREVRFDNDEVIEYGRMLLALGVKPETPNIPGARQGEVIALKTIDDALVLRKAVGSGRKILTLGKGFISFEVAWLATLAKSDVSVANRYGYPFVGALAKEQGEVIASAMTKARVKVLHGAEIRELLGELGNREAVFADGTVIPVEIIVAGVGVGTPSAWLHRVDRTADGAALVDRTLRTNVPDVWAAGDGAVLRDTYERAGNWETAKLMGSVAGENMTGGEVEYQHVPVISTEGFGVHVAFVGAVREREGVMSEFEVMDANSSIRRFMRDGKLIGAALLNRPQDIGGLKEEIQAS